MFSSTKPNPSTTMNTTDTYTDDLEPASPPVSLPTLTDEDCRLAVEIGRLPGDLDALARIHAMAQVQKLTFRIAYKVPRENTGWAQELLSHFRRVASRIL
jgi:hypothetical protein